MTTREGIVTKRQVGHTNRPSTRQIVGWGAALFCGILALINAAAFTSNPGIRILLVVAGVVLVGSTIVLMARWYFTRQKSAGTEEH